MFCGARLRRAPGKAEGLDEEAVERLLRAAFCCLAQLDDRGNVVRDFATLDQMLEASGVYERQPDRRELQGGPTSGVRGFRAGHARQRRHEL